ncbi:hypothetical protein VC83_03636 [Pseudogymnoascus destructans]|uniref:Uncharacterized protein n=1 Tax=Pseudogymnoascus destructans TaxID=655981 RepID=A0A177AF05_9PEZI|nr:uncharacterized protein VC83_03636 [Pseudogymnoascus destructans]OAF60699.1 hypothetical protein VC83_03636 [Pseudogymnoascus destructans]
MLEVNDEVLENIHEEFKTILAKCAIKVHSFQEAKGISGMKGLDSKVVDNFSSKLDLAREQETVETIDANHMEMARCSSRDDARYRQICGVLKQFVRTGLPSRETNSVNNKDRFSLAKQFIVPFSRDEHFVGREDTLGQLDLGGQQEAPKKHRRHALVGLGGVGKSQIAMSMHTERGSTDRKYQYSCKYQDPVQTSWHMILDNVDDGSVFFGNNDVVRGAPPHDQATNPQPPLETFLPHSRNGLILITSRNSAAADNLVDTFGKLVPVEPMEEKDSVDLLKAKIPADKCSEADLKELAQTLEGIPLAITHAITVSGTRQSIPERLLHNNTNQLLFENSIAPLLNFSLIREQSGGGSFEMHRLVQLSTRKWVELNGQLEKWRGEAIKITARLFPDGDYETWSDCQSLLPHAIRAEPILQEAIVVRERELVVTHPDMLTSVSNLASVLQRQGRYEEAESMNRRALEGRERELGVTHPDTLTSVSNLALVLQSQGRYEEAESMNRRALEGRERELGVTHPDTLTSVSNLALVLQSQGRYEEAESMNRRALEGRERELGVTHPDTLTSVSNLALVLQSQGRYEEAESMNRRALVSDLALLLQRQGRYEEAESDERWKGMRGSSGPAIQTRSPACTAWLSF